MVEKIKQMLAEIKSEKKQISLFALIKNEETIDEWSLVLSAKWADVNGQVAFDYLVSKLRSFLKSDELTKITRINLVKTDDKHVLLLNRLYTVSFENPVEIDSVQLMNFNLRNSLIFESNIVKDEVEYTPISDVPLSSVISMDGERLYWYARDGKRYRFIDERVFHTWFPPEVSYPHVYKISPTDLATIYIGGNVTYKPGTKLIKVKSDPKHYAISKGGRIHWVETDNLAKALFGENWKDFVDEVPDVFFVNYSIGKPITRVSDYDRNKELGSVRTVDDNIFP